MCWIRRRKHLLSSSPKLAELTELTVQTTTMPRVEERPVNVKQQLLGRLARIDRDIVFLCSNYQEYLPHHRTQFLNIQTMKYTIEADTISDLADLILRHKQACMGCIYMRIYEVAEQPPYVTQIVIQTGVMPEKAARDGVFDSPTLLIEQILRHLPPVIRDMHRPHLVQSPIGSPQTRVHCATLRSRSLLVALQEVNEILRMFRWVCAYNLIWRESDDQIVVVVHFKLPPLAAERDVSPLQLPPHTQSNPDYHYNYTTGSLQSPNSHKPLRGKCSRSFNKPSSPVSPSLPIMVVSASGRVSEVMSPPAIRSISNKHRLGIRAVLQSVIRWRS